MFFLVWGATGSKCWIYLGVSEETKHSAKTVCKSKQQHIAEVMNLKIAKCVLLARFSLYLSSS